MSAIGTLVRIIKNLEEPGVEVRMIRLSLKGGDQVVTALLYENGVLHPELKLMGPDIDITMRGVEYLFNARHQAAAAARAADRALAAIKAGADAAGGVDL